MNSFFARFPRIARVASSLFAAFAILSLALPATAQLPPPQIDLSLNLLYNDPANPLSGGTWQIAVKTTDFGLADVSFYLQNIRNSEAPTFLAPRGDVNGGSIDGPNAGFRASHSQILADGAIGHSFHLNQIPQPGSPDRPLFYGVGSIVDPDGGVPNFPGAATQFPDASFIGPSIGTLTNLLNAPWGTGDFLDDPLWSHAALLVTGKFDPGQTPSFLEELPAPISDPQGTIYLTLPMTSAGVGTVSSQLTPIYTVRDNLLAPAGGGDYNGDGLVNLADYTVWRDTLGATANPIGSGADGDGNGIIGAGDYTVWKNNFGLPIAPVAGIGTGSVSPVAVPEPQTLIITVLALAGMVLRTRAKATRNP